MSEVYLGRVDLNIYRLRQTLRPICFAVRFRSQGYRVRGGPFSTIEEARAWRDAHKEPYYTATGIKNITFCRGQRRPYRVRLGGRKGTFCKCFRTIEQAKFARELYLAGNFSALDSYCAQFRVQRLSSAGEKYIYVPHRRDRRIRRYIVRINNNIGSWKSYRTLDEARRVRALILREIDHLKVQGEWTGSFCLEAFDVRGK